MKFVAFTFLAMLVALVAGSPAPDLADKRHSVDVKLPPASSDGGKAQIMLSEALKRQEPTDCDNHYMIDCGGDFVKSYNCWYWNKTRCWCGKLTSEDPSCLSDCQCTHWDE